MVGDVHGFFLRVVVEGDESSSVGVVGVGLSFWKKVGLQYLFFVQGCRKLIVQTHLM